MDFFTLIGNGNGVILFFSPKQLDGNYYTTEVLAQLNEAAGLPNTASPLANKNGIFINSVEGKVDFYHRIRRFILPTSTAAYDFRVRVFLNSGLTEAQALQYILDGNALELVGLAATEELTIENDTAGFLVKLIG